MRVRWLWPPKPRPELAERQRAAGNLSRRDQSIQQAFYAQSLLEVAQAEGAARFRPRDGSTARWVLWGADTGWKIPLTASQLVPDALPPVEQAEAQAVAQRLDLAAAKKDAEAAAQALSLTRQFRYLSTFGIGVAYKTRAERRQVRGPDRSSWDCRSSISTRPM